MKGEIMKVFGKLLLLALMSLAVVACGSDGPPSSWNDMPLTVNFDNKYQVYKLKSLDNRPFTFGNLMESQEKESEVLWKQGENESWISVFETAAKENKKAKKIEMVFQQHKMDDGTTDGVTLLNIKMDGESLPPVSVAIMMAAFGERYNQSVK
jgi:hypothetical protein